MNKQMNPGGKATVTPYVVAKDAAKFLDFVERTFGVQTSLRVPNQDGTIGHAEVTIGDSVVMVFDAQPDWPDTPAFLSVYVDDVDKVVDRATAAGGTVITELMTSRIVGDRGGRIKDPVGNIWWVQTHLYDVDPASLGELFADPAELALMRSVQESFATEMRSRT
jgi:PhnB protein